MFISFHRRYVCLSRIFLVVKINALPCFLNGFGIAVLVFSYKKQQTGALVDFTRWRPTKWYKVI